MRSISSVHPDLLKWNRKYAGQRSSFLPHPMVHRLPLSDLPSGGILELAGGPSGSALALAEQTGRSICVTDISDMGLKQLHEEAEVRNLARLIQCLQVDLSVWSPVAQQFALVFGLRYWDSDLFVRACEAVLPGGYIAWETFSLAEQTYRPRFRTEWCLLDGEPASLLPEGFVIVSEEELDNGEAATRRLIAQRKLTSGP